jgi:hypothetical protein
MRISPLIKGIITAVAMLGVTLYTFYYARNNTFLPKLVFALYAAGIFWAIIGYSRTPAYQGKFGELFGQGFRCFIIVALFMAIFNFAFISAHPEFAERDGELYRKFLVEKKDQNRTPAEIDQEVKRYKKTYIAQNLSFTTFSYLVQGVMYTAAGAGLVLLLRRRK